MYFLDSPYGYTEIGKDPLRLIKNSLVPLRLLDKPSQEG